MNSKFLIVCFIVLFVGVAVCASIEGPIKASIEGPIVSELSLKSVINVNIKINIHQIIFQSRIAWEERNQRP